MKKIYTNKFDTIKVKSNFKNKNKINNNDLFYIRNMLGYSSSNRDFTGLGFLPYSKNKVKTI